VIRAVTIPERFCGPPGSGNGGYTCGLVATALDDGAVEVALKVPPPLERPLTLEVADAAARLLDGDTVVATARGRTEPIDAGPTVTAAETHDAVAHFDEAGYHAAHPFAGCFTCGPARLPGDGLRIFPAPTADPGVVVWTWTPDPGGPVPTELLWAALDCPGGQAWMRDGEVTAAVLGRLAVRVDRPAVPGDELIVAGWRSGRDGRRLASGSSLRTAAGELVAAANATWIELTPEQAAAFGVPT
jgi:hypothetical protein